MIVGLLQQFWIELAYMIQYADLNDYVQKVNQHYHDKHPHSTDFLEFYLDLVMAIITSNGKTP